MAGTKAGGIATAATNKLKYGLDYYKVIGARGGKNSHTGGFAARVVCTCAIVVGEHHKANCAGTIGGRISRRPAKKAAVDGV